ncbi:MAG: hypothetical protein WD151_11425 [Phycisphaeraceae bacterium]
MHVSGWVMIGCMLLAGGCVKTVSPERLGEIHRGRMGNSFATEWYYLGSDDRHHYFSRNYQGQPKGGPHYRVAVSQMQITDPFDYTARAPRWSPLPEHYADWYPRYEQYFHVWEDEPLGPPLEIDTELHIRHRRQGDVIFMPAPPVEPTPQAEP